MSVLIKGMEMPETCEKCGMHVAMILFSDGKIGHCMLLKGRADKRNCPLVEIPPHGRLIDADALYDYMCKTHDKWREDPQAHMSINPFTDDETMALYAPTIIEAEGER